MPILKVEMLKRQINIIAMLLSEFDFLPIYRADLAGSRTLSFDQKKNIYIYIYISADRAQNRLIAQKKFIHTSQSRS